VGGDFSFARIEADHDVAGKRVARIMQEPGILDGSRPDDYVGNPIVEITFDRVEVTDPAAELHWNLLADDADDFADDELVLGHTGDRAVEIDEMQPLRPLLEPMLRHGRRIFGK